MADDAEDSCLNNDVVSFTGAWLLLLEIVVKMEGLVKGEQELV